MNEYCVIFIKKRARDYPEDYPTRFLIQANDRGEAKHKALQKFKILLWAKNKNSETQLSVSEYTIDILKKT